jgi:disulfide oxidoreductase YuzD
MRTYEMRRYLSIAISAIGSLAAAATLSFALGSVFFEKGSTKEKKNNILQYENEFFTTTNKLIDKSDSLSINIETIKKIFNSIDRKSNGLLFKYGFINVLEDYSVSLITDTAQINNDNLYFIIELINDELRGEPFNNLKSEQRRILLNLQRAVKNSNIETGLYNLNELNDILRIQNEREYNLERQNAWSIPLAIIGILTSLVFGIISLVKSISKKKTNNDN